MKIYTKTGDQGQTSLLGGTRVVKSHLKIEAYGTVDELNAHIGMLRDLEVNEGRKPTLIAIQERLFTMGSLLAVDARASEMALPEIQDADIQRLEEEIDGMEQQLPPLKNFVLPGGAVPVSHTHIARCVCRRAERRVIDLGQTEQVSPIIVKYLNRLSDYLFVLSRKIAQELDAPEQPWRPAK